MESASDQPLETAGPEKERFLPRWGRSVEQGMGMHKPSLYNCQRGSNPVLGQRARPSSVQPPEGASSRWVLEGNGRAAGGWGRGFCRGGVATPSGVLITPPGQGQLQVQLLQILALQARAQLPGGVLLVWLRAEGPVCSRALVRSLLGPHPPLSPPWLREALANRPPQPQSSLALSQVGLAVGSGSPARSWARSLMRWPTMA